MQEAFEKVIKKLEELAESNRESGFDSERKGFSDIADKYYAKQCAYLNAIEIVKQTSTEYNNGWILCSERLPDKYNRVLAYTDAGGYYIAHINGCGKFVCTAECVSTVIENSDVIAWQPLPAPYQPTRKNCRNRHENGNCLAVGGFCTAVDDKYCKYQPNEERPKKTNFDKCCESMEAMAQIIDIAKVGWTKEQIMEWLQKEECEVPE